MRYKLAIIAAAALVAGGAGTAAAVIPDGISYEQMLQKQGQIHNFEDLARYDATPLNVWHALTEYQFYRQFLSGRCYSDWLDALHYEQDRAAVREWELRRRISVQVELKRATRKELRRARAEIRALAARVEELGG